MFIINLLRNLKENLEDYFDGFEFTSLIPIKYEPIFLQEDNSTEDTFKTNMCTKIGLVCGFFLGRTCIKVFDLTLGLFLNKSYLANFVIISLFTIGGYYFGKNILPNINLQTLGSLLKYLYNTSRRTKLLLLLTLTSIPFGNFLFLL